MSRHCILVIDDEELIRWSLRWHLERAGHQILEAACGREARHRLHEGVDLVVLDLRLPDADGLDLIREIKQNCPGCPIIVMTAQGTESAVEARRTGACQVVDKPFDFRQLAGLIDRTLDA